MFFLPLNSTAVPLGTTFQGLASSPRPVPAARSPKEKTTAAMRVLMSRPPRAKSNKSWRGSFRGPCLGPRLQSPLPGQEISMNGELVLDFSQIGARDVGRVGGKNASLGELYNALRSRGIGAVDGFATTSDFYRK